MSRCQVTRSRGATPSCALYRLVASHLEAFLAEARADCERDGTRIQKRRELACLRRLPRGWPFFEAAARARQWSATPRLVTRGSGVFERSAGVQRNKRTVSSETWAMAPSPVTATPRM